MLSRTQSLTASILVAAAMAGCGAGGPQHTVRPLTSRPAVTSDFTKLTTPEDKIKFIQDSNAPDSEKKKAIDRVNAGQL